MRSEYNYRVHYPEDGNPDQCPAASPGRKMINVFLEEDQQVERSISFKTQSSKLLPS